MNFLLTFNENWADEFDVTALACMTEEEFKEWKNKNLGIINEDYDKEIKEYEVKLKKRTEFVEELKKRNLYYTSYNHFTENEKKWYQENKVPALNYRPTKLAECFISTYLGNSGEGFEEPFMNYEKARDLLEASIVHVTVVDDNFKAVFDAANLSNLSLCNVFEIDENEW